MRIRILGSPTAEDKTCVLKVIEEINQIINKNLLTINNKNSNLIIYFVPVSEFKNYLPSYASGNYGFFSIKWDDNYNIINGIILISTTKIPQLVRSHIIREEVTQSLGLINDSIEFPNSIFYKKWSHTNFYLEIDKLMIKMLFMECVKPGMNKREILNIFEYN